MKNSFPLSALSGKFSPVGKNGNQGMYSSYADTNTIISGKFETFLVNSSRQSPISQLEIGEHFHDQHYLAI